MTLHRRSFLTTGVALGTAAILTRPALAMSLDLQVETGLHYFRARAAEQAVLMTNLTSALRSNDLATARAAYIAARPPYEQIEVRAAEFVEIDAAIDARPYAITGGETSAEFQGFHRIEALLFRDEDLRPALPYAARLQDSIAALQITLEDRNRFTAENSFAGFMALSEEVAAKKISSEEETWSDQSLLIFRHNFRGIESQFAPFLDAIADRDPTVAERAMAAFAHGNAALDPHFNGDIARPYSTVGMSARGEIVRAAYGINAAMEQSAELLGLL